MRRSSHFHKGKNSFENHRSADKFYIDKTLFIHNLLEEKGPSQITLITRPSGFGKTYLLSMVQSFFDIHSQEKDSLFKGLQISHSPYWIRRHQHPVIFLSFSDIIEPDCTPQEFETSFKTFLQRRVLEKYLDNYLNVTDEEKKVS